MQVLNSISLITISVLKNNLTFHFNHMRVSMLITYYSQTVVIALYRSTPLQVVHILGNFMRIWSAYSLYNYLSSRGDSIVGFIFSCLVPASVIFLVLQKPWKGRPLPNSQVPLTVSSSTCLLLDACFLCIHSCVLIQVIPTVVNGGILALYFVLWGKGLLTCGPLV
jgi:hypothetical protein